MVEWSNPAKLDLKRIYEYIGRDSNFYAKKVIDEIMTQSVSLNDFPKIGRNVPEINDPNIREIFVYSYRLIYEVQEDNVTILGLVHFKQDFSSGDLDLMRE